MRWRRLILVLVLGIATLSACSEATTDRDARFAPYVSIGDSYVSGPLISPVETEEPACLRSKSNYPHLVAAQGGLEVFDVACAGATTEDVVNGRPGGGTAPQLDALDEKVELVTVGIGANDAGLSAMWFRDCLMDSRSDESCRAFVKRAPAILSATRDRVSSVLKSVRRRAPEAEVILVGYLRVVPDVGSCTELPISEAIRSASKELERMLAETLRRAAADARVGFVDVLGISKGHDACAGKDSWVNGLVNPKDDGAYLHPNKNGMKAVAGEVLRAVRER